VGGAAKPIAAAVGVAPAAPYSTRPFG